MGERISGKQDGTSITIEGPPGPHKYNNIYIYKSVWSIYEKLVVLIFLLSMYLLCEEMYQGRNIGTHGSDVIWPP